MTNQIEPVNNSKKLNWVSSQVCSNSRHYIEPIPLGSDPVMTMNRLRKLLPLLRGVHIIYSTPDYLQAECHSKIFGFVDDLEFQLDIDNNVCHVRSASRTGYYDLGINRKRVEAIRKLFLEGKG